MCDFDKSPDRNADDPAYGDEWISNIANGYSAPMSPDELAEFLAEVTAESNLARRQARSSGQAVGNAAMFSYTRATSE